MDIDFVVRANSEITKEQMSFSADIVMQSEAMRIATGEDKTFYWAVWCEYCRSQNLEYIPF